MPKHAVSLDDKYALDETRQLLTGTVFKNFCFGQGLPGRDKILLRRYLFLVETRLSIVGLLLQFHALGQGQILRLGFGKIAAVENTRERSTSEHKARGTAKRTGILTKW